MKSRPRENREHHLPTGILYGRHRGLHRGATGQLNRARSSTRSSSLFASGHPVRLQDEEKAIDSVEVDKAAAWFIDQRAMVSGFNVSREPTLWKWRMP